MRGERPTRSLLAIACDWETTCLIRRIEFLDVQIAFAAWYFFRRLEVQFRAMLTQPGALVAVVWALLCHQRPEAR
jgi:hypothetical protein